MSACLTVQVKGRNILRGGLNELSAIDRSKLLVKAHAWFCSLTYAELCEETKHFLSPAILNPL